MSITNHPHNSKEQRKQPVVEDMKDYYNTRNRPKDMRYSMSGYSNSTSTNPTAVEAAELIVTTNPTAVEAAELIIVTCKD